MQINEEKGVVKKEIPTYTVTWMNLEDIIPRDIKE